MSSSAQAREPHRAAAEGATTSTAASTARRVAARSGGGGDDDGGNGSGSGVIPGGGGEFRKIPVENDSLFGRYVARLAEDRTSTGSSPNDSAPPNPKIVTRVARDFSLDATGLPRYPSTTRVVSSIATRPDMPADSGTGCGIESGDSYQAVVAWYDGHMPPGWHKMDLGNLEQVANQFSAENIGKMLTAAASGDTVPSRDTSVAAWRPERGHLGGARQRRSPQAVADGDGTSRHTDADRHDAVGAAMRGVRGARPLAGIVACVITTRAWAQAPAPDPNEPAPHAGRIALRDTAGRHDHRLRSHVSAARCAGAGDDHAARRRPDRAHVPRRTPADDTRVTFSRTSGHGRVQGERADGTKSAAAHASSQWRSSSSTSTRMWPTTRQLLRGSRGARDGGAAAGGRRAGLAGQERDGGEARPARGRGQRRLRSSRHS